MPDKRDQQRTKFFIDKEVQGGILRRVALHWSLLIVCSSLTLMVWVRLFEVPDQSWSEVSRICYWRFIPFIVVSLALLPAFARDTVKFSNRFAGPIKRLHQALQQAASDESPKHIRFRKGDFWNDVAVSFNTLADKVTDQQKEIDVLRAQIQILEGRVESVES